MIEHQDGLVSIITPSYNSSKYITQTIESVLSQSYTNWEMLITDDCSTDDSVQIIESFSEKDSRIKLFKLEKNSGAGVARNNSIKESKGQYFAFLDSDDRWMPDNLERKVSFMRETGCSVVYSSYLTCSEGGENLGIVVCRKHETAFSIKCDDKMGALTFMYDMSKVGKLYMPIIRKRQDWCYKMMVMQIAKDAYGIKEPLGIYRLANNSLSRNKRGLVKYNILSYQVTLGWSKLKAVLFFCFAFIPSYFMKRLELKWINR